MCQPLNVIWNTNLHEINTLINDKIDESVKHTFNCKNVRITSFYELTLLILR